jgi:hypothetical protein
VKTLLRLSIVLLLMGITYSLAYRHGERAKAQQLIRMLDGLRMKPWDDIAPKKEARP